MKRLLVLLLCGAVSIAGCAGVAPERRGGTSGSLIDYLYPDGETPPEADGHVEIGVPATVGLAFVPPRRDDAQGENVPTAAMQAQLLQRVRERFEGRDYIRDIRIIPATYLQVGEGVTTLRQVARLYGVDVMALVSYDQVTFGSERTSSLLYWTIAGAYVVKGNRDDVHTFVDTAVLDVRSERLLFRAPGVDVRNANTTFVEGTRNRRLLMEKSLQSATEKMIDNLDNELTTFRKHLAKNPTVKIRKRPGAGVGAGATTPLALLVLGCCLAVQARERVGSREPRGPA